MNNKLAFMVPLTSHLDLLNHEIFRGQTSFYIFKGTKQTNGFCFSKIHLPQLSQALSYGRTPYIPLQFNMQISNLRYYKKELTILRLQLKT